MIAISNSKKERAQKKIAKTNVAIFCLILFITSLPLAKQKPKKDNTIALPITKIQKSVVVIAITMACKTKFRYAMGISWPWPREGYGIMLDYLKKKGATSAAFNLLFSEVSMYSFVDDKKFLDAIKRFGPVFFAAYFTDLSDNPATAKKRKALSPHQKKALAKKYAHTSIQINHFAMQTAKIDNQANITESFFLHLPHWNFTPLLAGIGNSLRASRKTGNSKRKRLFIKFQNRIYPSLNLAMIMHILKIKKVEIKKNSLILIKPDKQRIKIMLDKDGYALLDFPNLSNKIKIVRASDILSAAMDPAFGKKFLPTNFFKDKMVLFLVKPTIN